MLTQQRTFTNARAGRVGEYFPGFSEPHGRLIEHLRSFRFGDEAQLGRAVHLVSLGAAVLEGMEAIEENVLQTVRQARAALVVLDGYRGLRGVLESETERCGSCTATPSSSSWWPAPRAVGSTSPGRWRGGRRACWCSHR